MFILRILQCFDYITPIIHTVEDVKNGTGMTLFIHYTKIDDARQSLSEAGINTWSVCYPAIWDNEGYLSVSDDNFGTACSILDRKGIEYRY